MSKKKIGWDDLDNIDLSFKKKGEIKPGIPKAEVEETTNEVKKGLVEIKVEAEIQKKGRLKKTIMFGVVFLAGLLVWLFF